MAWTLLMQPALISTEAEIMVTCVKQMLEAANAVVPRVTPTQTREMMAEDNALVVDVRDAPELAASGKVAGAVHVPRGMLEFRADPESPYHDKNFAKDKTVILYCASGGRAALALLRNRRANCPVSGKSLTRTRTVYRRRATGSAVVGDLVDFRRFVEHTIVGETLARLQRLRRCLPSVGRGYPLGCAVAELFLISELDLAAVAACPN